MTKLYIASCNQAANKYLSTSRSDIAACKTYDQAQKIAAKFCRKHLTTNTRWQLRIKRRSDTRILMPVDIYKCETGCGTGKIILVGAAYYSAVTNRVRTEKLTPTPVNDDLKNL